MPTTAQLIADLNVQIAKIQADDARDRETVRCATLHYTPSRLDVAEGQGRR